jgi:hypothetical protein
VSFQRADITTSQNFIVPPNVTKLDFDIIGGGAGGGNGGTSDAADGGGGGGAGGGALMCHFSQDVTPGDVVAVVIGIGGPPGGSGNDTSVTGPAAAYTLIARGAHGGNTGGNAVGTGGTGGLGGGPSKTGDAGFGNVAGGGGVGGNAGAPGAAGNNGAGGSGAWNGNLGSGVSGSGGAGNGSGGGGGKGGTNNFSQEGGSGGNGGTAGATGANGTSALPNSGCGGGGGGGGGASGVGPKAGGIGGGGGSGRVIIDWVGTFLPTNLSGLVLWLRADLGVTLNGGNVSAWNDQSGTGDANKNVLQAVAGNQPLYNSTTPAYNNKPSVQGAAGKWLAGTPWAAALAQPYTVFIVGNTNGAAGSVFWDTAGGGGTASMQGAGGTGVVNMGAGLSSLTPVTTPSVFGADINGGASKTYVNARTATNTGNAGALGLTSTTVLNDVSHGFPEVGPLAEVVIYNRILSSSERAALMTYLGARYAITIGA